MGAATSRNRRPSACGSCRAAVVCSAPRAAASPASFGRSPISSRNSVPPKVGQLGSGRGAAIGAGEGALSGRTAPTRAASPATRRRDRPRRAPPSLAGSRSGSRGPAAPARPASPRTSTVALCRAGRHRQRLGHARVLGLQSGRWWRDLMLAQRAVLRQTSARRSSTRATSSSSSSRRGRPAWLAVGGALFIAATAFLMVSERGHQTTDLGAEPGVRQGAGRDRCRPAS